MQNKRIRGTSPAVMLTNPKFPHNVGATVRAASCWGVEQVYWTGRRVPHPENWPKEHRLPREERMKGYRDVTMLKAETLKDTLKNFDKDVVPVAIELRPNSEILFDFIHPENAIYIFGPEDGSLDWKVLQHCHRFVVLPTAHCTNLAAAVNVVLAHIKEQMYKRGLIPNIYDFLEEDRGFIANC